MRRPAHEDAPPTRPGALEQLQEWLATFPRHHAVAACVLLALFGLTLIVYPSSNVNANRKSAELELQFIAEGPLPAKPVAATTAPPPSKPAEIKTPEWHALTVKPGDTLSQLFTRAGLNDAAMYRVLHSGPDAKALTRIYPGQTVEFKVDDNGLQALRLVRTKLEQLEFDRTAEGTYAAREIIHQPDISVSFRQAELRDNLFLSASRVGLTNRLILDLANIFGGVIDFVYDPRPGDTFNVMFEEQYFEGERLGEGEILAATYTNEGKTYTAFRYTDPHGDTGYFSPEGESMRKAFLRAPLDFTRISSNFNPNRLHPVFKTVRPHRGTDYAAPRGTPVYAAGNGRILESGYSKANGNYVFVQHGESYVTKYLHLDKRAVKAGQRVKQGQIIGRVGATGYATGPHLHYEFLVNGVHRNPRTIIDQLPKAQSIPADERDHFERSIQPLQTQFAGYVRSSDTQYALSDDPARDRGT